MKELKKTALIVLGAIIAVMGLLEITGILNLGTEPAWHAWLKVLIGAAAIIVPFTYKKQINTALYVISGLLVIMGILALIPGIDLATEPLWHSITKIVVGGIGILIARKKK
ncbi:MAG: hypothetical protein PHG04_00445 [Candidatus Nanoarchaeia archaeon]|nr:hypothetical protein [Candidatus Nanoarchaeia archaeon]